MAFKGQDKRLKLAERELGSELIIIDDNVLDIAKIDIVINSKKT